MAKVTVNVDRLKERLAPEEFRLVNFRLKPETLDAFKELCKKEFGKDYSSVLRAMIEDLCEQKGYLKK